MIRQNQKAFMISIASASLFCAAATGTGASSRVENDPARKTLKRAATTPLPADYYTSRDYNLKILNKVDDLVQKHLYSKKLVQSAWIPAVKRGREAVLQSKNLSDLFKSINAILAELKSSHCEFVTRNDETFYFLHDLFGSFNKKLLVPIVDAGFVTGPPRFAHDQVRYVLDDSPAAGAGIQVGDKILAVNGRPWIGVESFAGYAGKPISIAIEREGKRFSVSLTPKRHDAYQAYVNAITKSNSIRLRQGYKIGYVHYWCGNRDAHDAFEKVLSSHNIANSDALILDLRDGYGGNSIEDVEYFYRNALNTPEFLMIGRDGKTIGSREYYDKPVVALINDGSRSGKELLAFSLQRAKRAKLIGTNTAGAFLGGHLDVLDDKTALYLAVADCTVDGTRLEGLGVAPDIVVPDDGNQTGKEKQIAAAMDEIIRILNEQKAQPADTAQ